MSTLSLTGGFLAAPAARATASGPAPDSPRKSLWPDIRHIGWLVGAYVRSEPLIAAALIAGQAVPLGFGTYLFLQTQLNVAEITNALVAGTSGAIPELTATAVTLGVVALALGVVGSFSRLILRIRLRQAITEGLLSRWLTRDRFYHLERRAPLDHPEQRIQEDVFQFVDQLLTLAPTVLGSLLSLLLYVGQLWRLSPPLALPLFGFDEPIPGVLLYVALASSILWTALTHWIGRVLTRVEVVRQRLEAQFRQELGAVRENGESIAFARGGDIEHARLTRTFGEIRRNWRGYVVANLKIETFGSLPETVLVVGPILFCIPYVAHGEMQVGDIAILGLAFRQVYNSVGIFVALYPQLAVFRSAVARLRTMHELLETDAASDIEVARSDVREIRLEGLSVAFPDGSAMTDVGDLAIAPGTRLLVQGRSGAGKSTLLRAIAGLWPHGRGRVTLPCDARIAFLPQRGYMPDGSLASLMSYPLESAAHPDARYLALLDRLSLGVLKPRLHENAPWSRILSPGEQQRIIAARAVLAEPDFLFVDEATSALDAESERQVYALIVESLPDAALVSVAHRPTVKTFHNITLRLTQRSDDQALFIQQSHMQGVDMDQLN